MRLIPYKKAALDKLKFAFAQDEIQPYTRDIKTALDDMVRAGRATKLSTQGKGYVNRYRVVLNDKDGLLVEVTPNRPDNAKLGLTMEYTPAHLDKSERAIVVEVVHEILGTDARRLLGTVVLLIVHIAVDFPFDIDEVAIEARSKSTCASWGKVFGDKSFLQTQYFGSSASDSQVVAYDKGAELYVQLAKAPATTTKLFEYDEEADKLGPRLRLEDKKTLTRSPVPLHDLAQIAAPFRGVHVYAMVDAEEKLKSPLERQTLALAKAVGLQAALNGLDKGDREKIRRKLISCQVEWWDATTYSNALEKRLKATRLFPDDAFHPVAEREKLAKSSSVKSTDRGDKKRKEKLATKQRPGKKKPH
ncbi:hypothetical protein [Rhodoferax sp. GW822-FHT02A01]|uniref:hypothetical protein n=1 Tax=Rhodoferax sp. GW822-FHT02A01 TaxID=3141537 RepID=UPI00315C7289